MAIAGNLQVNASAKTADFESGMRKMRQELSQTQQFVKAFTGDLTHLGSRLGGIAAGVVGFQALKAGITDVVRTGLDLERLRTSFTAITGSASASGQEFAFITETANRLGLGLQELGDSYRGLAAATRGTALAGQETRELFTALTTASRVYGLSTDETGRALTAFQQIISKGKVSQEELRGQLGEAIPGASQIAARAFGVTTQALDVMIEKGLNAVEFTRRFTAQAAKRDACCYRDCWGRICAPGESAPAAEGAPG